MVRVSPNRRMATHPHPAGGAVTWAVDVAEAGPSDRTGNGLPSLTAGRNDSLIVSAHGQAGLKLAVVVMPRVRERGRDFAPWPGICGRWPRSPREPADGRSAFRRRKSRP